MAMAVSGGEYRPENHQRGQREGPEAEVFAERPQAPFGTVG
jgi:hypothetical protein